MESAAELGKIGRDLVERWAQSNRSTAPRQLLDEVDDVLRAVFDDLPLPFI